jgi:O-antigen ligase
MKPDQTERSTPATLGARLLGAFRGNKHSLLLATLGVYVITLPVAHTIALRNLAFLALLVLTLALLLERKEMPQFPLWRAWLAYATVGLIAVFLGFDPEASMREFRTEFLYCYTMLLIGSIWGKQFASFKAFALLLAAANLVLVSSAFMFAGLAMTFDSVMRVPAIAYAGLDNNWILMVIFLNVWLVIVLWQEKKRVLPLVLVGLLGLDIWAMLVGYNRQAWVALGIGMASWSLSMLYQKFSWWRVLAIACGLGIVVLLFSIQLHRRTILEVPASMHAAGETSAIEEARVALGKDQRWELWRFSLEKIAARPLVGSGPGRDVFRKLYPEFHPDDVNLWHAHNMILNKGIQMGIPGILTFLFLWFALAREMLRYARKSQASGSLAVAGLSIIGTVFVKNMTDDFFVRNTALMFWLIMGLVLGVLHSSQSGQKHSEAASADSIGPGR